MKRILVTCLILSSLFAQETGSGAALAAETARSNQWQSWAFAGSALVTVTAGIFAVALSQGAHSH